MSKSQSTEEQDLARENRLLREILEQLLVHIVARNAGNGAVRFDNRRSPPGRRGAGARKMETARAVETPEGERWIVESTRPMSFEGEPLDLSIEEDVTEFKAAENAVKIRENRIKAILDTAVEGIITINERGVIETYNQAAAHMFGYTASETVGRNVKMLMPEPYHSAHDGYLSRYLETGAPKIIGKGREVVGRRKDGSLFPIQLSVGVVYLQPGMLFTGIIRDLSEYKQMQEEVARAQHLAMIGEMCASIAHEIRNPLAGINGAMQVICRETDADDPRREILGEVLEQVTRLSRSVNDLLMFTKQWNAEKRLCNLAELVRKVWKAVEMEPDFARIQLRVDSALEKADALCDPKLVEQVLWNLLHNARDACGSNGVIEVCYGETQEFNQLIVCDNGCGIDPERLEKVFKPFFTTKTRGTGLGLPITRQIMNAHGGKVSVDSEVGKGSQVSLSFPRLP